MIGLRVMLWAALGILVYTYVGYPFLALLFGQLVRRRKDNGRVTPFVALIITAWNEEAWIGRRLRNALELDYPADRLEIIVCSDGSTDETDAIVRGFATEGVRLIRSETRVGQGRCQALGAAATAAEVVVFSDANTLFDADALTHLVSSFGDPSVGCVVGSLRYHDAAGSRPTGEGVYWRYEEALKAAESRLGACVSGTGAIYAIRRKAYRRADERAPTDFFLPLLVAGQGLKVRYEPRAVAHEEAAEDVWAELRRHTRTAERGAFCLLRVRVARRLLDPIRFPRLAWQLVSHKVIRWLTGLWLALAVLSAALLVRAGSAYAAIAAALGLLLILALWGAGEAVLRTRRSVPVTRLAFFFLATSVAMLFGFSRAVTGASRVTWQPQRSAPESVRSSEGDRGASVRRAAKHVVRRLPVEYRTDWSIGVLAGPALDALAAPAGVRNPILTRRNVTDVDAAYVADPFVVRDGGEFLMFFEVVGKRDGKGRIGLARSGDGLRWTYDRVVLEESLHLSFPITFVHESEAYMLPESHQADCVRLYRAARFPVAWTAHATLLEGVFADVSILHTDLGWWLFACDLGNDVLRLLHAERIEGPYTEHPTSPIIERDRHGARPAGRVRAWDGRLFRVSQDCHPYYGLAVDVREIERLTRDDYAETRPRRILRKGGWGWRRNGMHHLDALEVGPGRWIAWVDGWRRVWRFRGRRFP